MKLIISRLRINDCLTEANVTDHYNLTRSIFNNHFLKALPSTALANLFCDLRTIEFDLQNSDYLFDLVKTEILFVDTGLVSLVHKPASGLGIEVASLSPSNWLGTSFPLALQNIELNVVPLIAGKLFFIRPQKFFQYFEQDLELRDLTLKFDAFLLQEAYSKIVCNDQHSLANRISSWILTASECSTDKSISITHETLSMLFGVHRPTVTILLSKLKRLNIIQYTSRSITIKNRSALEDRACICHRQKKEFTCSATASNFKHKTSTAWTLSETVWEWLRVADAAEEQAAHSDIDHGTGHIDALLVITDQPTPAHHPAECALRDPALRQ